VFSHKPKNFTISSKKNHVVFKPVSVIPLVRDSSRVFNLKSIKDSKNDKSFLKIFFT